ncbi:MAG: hypothetical protein AVDCRST_MAG85-4160 [uncultured Solirubrobacteraceae bacterium]|uniref:NAD(P)-binding domain-containing protein n=1 Tax=uncultured Solirubrobacteraceae bacterium TaxID=1162706 RepID=A0A6J4TZU8_9ACTN|nr:MAG: hypothetical protein AVDCRST_MAG85-4160 [uncultured Solirubrobacteraceae bacterium]
MIVLVAGAGGHLGRELLAELRRRGHTTRALVRDPAKLPADAADEVVVADAEHADLEPACRGADVVFSAMGASSRFDRGPRRHYRETDTKPNLRLLEAAERNGVDRFAYVTILHAEKLRGNAYIDAHEDVVDRLHDSKLAHTIIRANGFFSIYDEMLDTIEKGRYRLIGDPDRLHNPIHDADLAAACADALENGTEEVEVGGPETLTRRQEAELAYAALGQAGTPVRRLPTPLVRVAAAVMRPADPRRAAVADLIWRISSIDALGPAYGTRTLGDYLASRASQPPTRTSTERSASS